MDLSDGQEDAGDQGDETISLSDVLVARDSCLPEDELWALCRECCLVLEVVNNSPDQFQTLCVTPDTVAFDQMGNVCFLDLDVDPDPIYLPPEYSSNGNPYKAHLFSLGMTLLYAAEYNVDHSKEKITPELHDLLGRMTADSTTHRPDLESTIILCEEQLCGQSSQEVCCGIAAVAGFGLPQEDYITVESMYWKGTNLSNFYDVSSSSDENPNDATTEDFGNSLIGKKDSPKRDHFDENVVTGSYATEVDEFSQLESYANSELGDTTCCDDIPDITEDVSQAESLPWSDEGSVQVTGTFESPNDSVVTNDDSTMENRRRRKVSPQTGTSSWGLNEGTLKQNDGNNGSNEVKKPKPALPKKPDSILNLGNNKVSVSELPKGAVGDLIVSELLSESDTDQSRVDSDKNLSEAKASVASNSTSKSNMSDKAESKTKTKERNGSSSSGKEVTVDKNQNVSKSVKSEMDIKGQTESMQKPSKSNGIEEKKTTDMSKPSTDTTALKNKRNKRKQGLTVTDILDSLDRNLTEEEMWALCKEGTAALQRKKKHLPAYLSPDTLLIRESGSVSFKAIPEEKPLEVIFMAPELQSKGELSEKTCLYGLSVTLRCAAGKKYSPFSSLSVSQDLKELLTFLADSNPAKRPELTDISKVCTQHSNGTSSDTVCARILQEAFAALSDIEEKVSNKNKEETPPQPPPVEQTPASSNDTNISGLAKPSAFKPMVGSGGFQPIKPAPIGTNIGGAFCPVPKKLPEIPEPRIPSAFSSPATHFKPIILQQTEKSTNEKLGSLKEEDKKPKEKSQEKPKSSASKEKIASPKESNSASDNPNDSDKEVVKKLKELKKNLMKHRQPTTIAKEIENEEKLNDSSTAKSAKTSSSSSRRSLPSTHKSKSEKSEKSEKQGASKDALESLLKEIQKQGNAPDTQILASAIAQYLKGQMGQAGAGQGHSNLETKSENPDSSVELDMTVTSGQAQLTQGQILPNLPSQLHSQLLGHTMSLPLHQYGGNVITGLPQFQFQQDPVTGFLQLTPVVPLRPMSVHSNSGSGRSNSGVDFASPIGTSSVVRDGPSPHMSPKSIHNQSDVSNASAISDPTGSKPKGLHGRTAKDLVQKTANLRAKNLSRPSPLHDSMGMKDNGTMSKWKSDHALNSSTDLTFFTGEDQTRHKSSSSLSNKLPTGYIYDDTYVGSQRRPHPAIQMPNGQFINGVPNNRLPDNYRVRTHSNSSSPSPSKDSGVSGMNVIGGKSHPNADVSLMDRLLNSNVNGKQQRTLGKIVHLLREEFAFDGYMENGVEDLAMAEYIASLGVLKWETFTSAISEKYCDLYWGTDLLANLYSAVNGTRPSSASKLNTKKPPMPKKSPQRQNEDEDSSLSENNDHSREITHNRLQPDIPGTRRPHSSYNPRNKLQDTSDSTDNEHYEKRRKKKSKHELDKMKSSSSNNLLEGTGVFVPSLNVPENTESIIVVKALEENGDAFNGNIISDSQKLSLPQNNPLFNRQNSMDSALDNRTTASLPNTLSASFDGRPPTGAQNGRSGHGKMNGVTGPAVGRVTDANGLKREVSMSSHSSSQSDALRDSEALPVDKKGHVVYHWAMIQLCMNPEMERFMQDIDEENSQMLLGKLSALDQQLKMERRLRKKTQRYYRNLVDQSKNPLEIGKPDKTTKAEKNQLSQAAKDITEMTQRIRFIDLCKTHIQMLLAELQGIDVSYLFSIAVCPTEEPLQLHPRPDNPLLQFQNLREAQTGCEIQALHAGTPEGLMAYLFASTALSEGFIHQFFFCYRYFTTASDVLQFLVSRYTSATQAGSTETNISRLQQRVIDLLHFWIEGYYSIDFHGRAPLVTYLRNFIRDHIKEESERGQSLIALLSNCCSGNHLELSSADPEESEMHFWQKEGTKLKQNEKSEKKSEFEYWKDRQIYSYNMGWDSFKSLVRGKSSSKDKAGKVKISAVVVERRRRSAGSQEILPMTSMSRRNDSFMLADYTSLCLAEQLCLIEQGIFQLTHPVHYLDSKSRGVGVALTMKGMRTPAVTRRSMFEESSSLFVEAILDSSAIQKMIDHSEEVSHWVSAEIVSASNNKTQVTVLSKFIFIAHTCAELRNYATAMAILDGLENLIIKQLPAWKHLPAKCTSVMEQLEATRMLLKNDPLSLMQQGKECYLYPTIPCAVLFLLHIQQSEIGGFKLANQMYKWGKIRSIAQVIDQIRVFREHIYGFEADHQVQDTLRQRISEMSSQDITTIASQNEMNFQKVSTGSGISGAFKKMKGKLK